ncbi:MAG: TonB family protein [Acidobacteria bacterium]|nr:TonB family protein [Acidobacteriota bacterium]
MRVIFQLFVLASTITLGACATRGAVFVPANDVTLPILVNSVRPYYTQEALASRIEGSVLLHCVVRADGTVGDVQVARSLDSTHGLDAQAMQAVKQWTFKPGTRRGKPVAVRVPVDITFTLR